jgi:hypothetical protein
VSWKPGVTMIVGSVPLDGPREVFQACASALSPYLGAYPDGETGDRKYWTFGLAQLVYSKHPDLVSVNAPEGGEVTQPGKDASSEAWNKSWWTFRLRDGVESLTFDRLHYAPAAAESYAVFARLREDGVVPADARFQVSLPATGSAVMGFFARADEWPVIYDAYRRAIRAEVARIVEQVPSEDLVIQWDIASEVRDILAGDRPLLPWSPQTSVEEKWQRHLGDMNELSYEIPDEVGLGYHFCFGTWGGWPKSVSDDISIHVRLANEAVRRAGRRVDYVHMPVMPDAGDDFFPPLEELSIGETKAFLGIVLNDGLENFERRATAAGRHLSDFGIASYCGWGREAPGDVPALLADLQACCERFTQMPPLPFTR